MKFFVLLFFSYTCVFAQVNPFKTFYTSNNFDDLEYKDAFYENSSNQQYHASELQVIANNIKLSGINITFQSLDLHQVDSFFFKVYSDNNGVPDQILFQEDIHKNNYFCNQNPTLDSTGQNIDFFFRNPVYLEAGDYWIAFYASLISGATEQPKLMHCSSHDSYLFDGNLWSPVNSTIKFDLYGVGDFIEPLSAFEYNNSLGPLSLDGWVFSDLFPEGILGFEVSDEVYDELGDDEYSLKMSSDYALPFPSQMFYNLTSPKFTFLANHTYALEISVHPAVYPSGRSFPAFGFVFVPDPPELGFLEQIPGNTVGFFPEIFDLDSILHNDNFHHVVHYFTPTSNIETRVGIHMELGEIPQGETAEYWLDNFSIKDTSQNIGITSINNEPISVFQNDFNDILQIKTNQQIDQIILFNISGQQLKTENNTKQMDISTFPIGLYFVELNIGNQKVIKKVIKQ